MSNLWFSLLLLVLCQPVYASENLSDFSDKSIPVLNDELRSLNNNANKSRNLLNSYFTSDILNVENGGTGQDFSAASADSLFYFDSTGHFGTVGIGTTGYFLVAGSPPHWVNIQKDVPIALRWGQIDSLTVTNVGIGTSGGLLASATDRSSSPISGYIYWLFDNTSYDDMFQKDPIVFQKKSDINTISGTFYLWEQSGGTGGGGGRQVSCYVDIGGQVSSTSTSQSITPTSKSWSVDVSSLSNGTNYSIKLMCRDDLQGGNATVGYVAKFIGYPS